MKTLWRADSYYKTIKQVEASDDAPEDEWLWPLMGDGEYIYAQSEMAAKAYLTASICQEIEELNNKLLELL